MFIRTDFMSKGETEKSYQQPDALGHFGPYGGRFVPETLMHPIDELIAAYEEAKDDPAFHNELDYLLANYVGRPTPLMLAQRLRSEEHTSELQSQSNLVCRLLLEKKKTQHT